MTSATWNRTEERTPPTGDPVTVITEGGDERTLRYHDNLWWLPDNSMYVYFTPTFWRIRS